MGNRSFKKRIASLEIRIAEHFQKINAELASVNPNVGLIKHWEAEINAFTVSAERARKRLG